MLLITQIKTDINLYNSSCNALLRNLKLHFFRLVNVSLSPSLGFSTMKKNEVAQWLCKNCITFCKSTFARALNILYLSVSLLLGTFIFSSLKTINCHCWINGIFFLEQALQIQVLHIGVATIIHCLHPFYR